MTPKDEPYPASFIGPTGPIHHVDSYRDGIERAANEVQIVCDRMDKATLGEELAAWLRRLLDDPTAPHPGADNPGRNRT